MTTRVPVIVVAWLLLLFVALALGGSGSQADRATLDRLSGMASDLSVERTAVLVTHAGGAPVLLATALLGAGWLWFRKRAGEAILLVAIVLAGRASVELLKLIVERPRPDLAPYPVAVSSYSFPSGHAANSMITLLALALMVAPPSARAWAVGAAVAVSIAIGLTRPMLGVHWPSDVIAGWAFGIAWVTAFAPLVSRRGETTA